MLGVNGVSGPGATRNLPRPAARVREHTVMNVLSNTVGNRQHRADVSREQLARRCAVDLPAHALGRVLCHGHSPIEQRRQVVRQYLGGHIDQQGVLAQPADTLQTQAVLQALERFFNAPTPVIQIEVDPISRTLSN